MKNFKILAFALSFLVTSVAFAQKDYYKDAQLKEGSLSYIDAIELYKKAYAKTKDKAVKSEVVFRIAECYRHLNDLKQAETWYQKSIKAKYSDPIAILRLADMLKENEKYAEAQIQYNKYLETLPGDKKGENGAKSCELAQKWKDNPTRYVVANEAQLNTASSDFSPCYIDKKYTDLYFTSTRSSAGGTAIDEGTGENFSDIYESKQDKKGKWSSPTPLGAAVNSSNNEGSVSITHKFNRLFYTRCPNEKKKNLGCEIFVTDKKGTDWDASVLVKVSADTLSVGQPCLNVDETRLYFSSDMPGGQGGHDIWYVEYNKKANTWSETPINLGATINTSEDDYFPYLHEDGSLYFSSNGHIGMGGLDIFRADKVGDGFGNVVNLKYPINSSKDDFGIIFQGSLEKGYFCSNRDGTKGADDIYSFILPPLIFTIQGVIKDVEKGIPVEGAVVKLIGSDGSSVEMKTDASGAYKFAENGAERYIKANTTYTLQASSNKYLNSEKAKISTVNVEESKTFEQAFGLQFKHAKFEVKNILYDLNSAALRPESMIELDKLIAVLIDNPNTVIELSSHTDSRGSDTANQSLSQRRAQSCVDYIISKSIDTERLVAAGKGETELKVNDAKIAKMKTNEEKEASHQVNRRTEFRILREDYVPKKKDPSAPVAPAEQTPPPVAPPEKK